MADPRAPDGQPPTPGALEEVRAAQNLLELARREYLEALKDLHVEAAETRGLIERSRNAS